MIFEIIFILFSFVGHFEFGWYIQNEGKKEDVSNNIIAYQNHQKHTHSAHTNLICMCRFDLKFFFFLNFDFDRLKYISNATDAYTIQYTIHSTVSSTRIASKSKSLTQPKIIVIGK